MHTKIFGSVGKEYYYDFLIHGRPSFTARANFYRWLHMFWQAWHVSCGLSRGRWDVTAWCNMYSCERQWSAMVGAGIRMWGEFFKWIQCLSCIHPWGEFWEWKHPNYLQKLATEQSAFAAVFQTQNDFKFINRSFELYYEFWGTEQALSNMMNTE